MSRDIARRKQKGRKIQEISEKPASFEKIISGGQTGVDRAALDVALELRNFLRVLYRSRDPLVNEL